MPKITNIKTSWDFKKTLGYKNISDPKINSDLKKAKLESYKFINTWKDDSSYLTSVKSLKKALDQYEHWQANFSTSSNVDYFLSLKQSLNQNNSRISAKLNKVIYQSKQIENDIQFFLLNLSKLDANQQKIFLKSHLLKDYQSFLKHLFLVGKHTLSDDSEKILNLKSQVSYSNWVKMTSRLLSKQTAKVINSKGKLQTLSFSNIYSLIDHPQKNIRQKASRAFTKILDDHSDVAESELNSILENKMIDDNLRAFSRPDSSRLLSDNIDPKIIDSMIELVTQNFKLSRLFYTYKAKLLGKQKLQYSERNLSLSKVDKLYSYQEAIQTVNSVFQNLDPQFSQIFVSFLKNGQIDAFPKKGKTDGAFCSAGLKKATSFVLLNHNNKLRDVTTIAHEMGHAINNELTRQSQNSLNFDTTLATAEVSSTFFEDFVFKKIKDSLSPSLQLSLLFKKLDDEVATIFRQVALYNFETELHALFRKKGYLSKKLIGNLFIKHMSSYLGDSIDMSGFQNWWVYWSHIRRPFYVYSYASGLLISKYFQSRVKEDLSYINQVKTFLSAGTSKSPQQIFESMGVDITQKSFWKQGIRDFSHKLNQLRKNAV